MLFYCFLLIALDTCIAMSRKEVSDRPALATPPALHTSESERVALYDVCECVAEEVPCVVY